MIRYLFISRHGNTNNISIKVIVTLAFNCNDKKNLLLPIQIELRLKLLAK